MIVVVVFLGSIEQIGRGRTYLIVMSERERTFKKFQTVGREIVLSIRNPPSRANSLTWLENAIIELFDLIVSNHDSEEFVGLSIASSHFKNGNIWISFRPVCEFHYMDLWEMIQSVVQSNDEFRVDQTLSITAAFVQLPRGSGKVGLTHETIQKSPYFRSAIKTISAFLDRFSQVWPT